MAEGFITDIKHDPNGRFGPSWQLYVDGKTLGFMKYEPKGYAIGDYVTYETEQKGQYQNLKAGTLSKSVPPAGAAAPTRPEPSKITMDRQDVISRQAALNTALSFVQLLQVAGALPEGKSLTPAKKADKMEAILMEYVKKFHLLSTGTVYEVPEAAAEAAAQSWDEQE